MWLFDFERGCLGWMTKLPLVGMTILGLSRGSMVLWELPRIYRCGNWKCHGV